MLVLAIESSSEQGSVALYRHTEKNGGLLAHASHQEPNRHAERLLGLVDSLFVQSGVDRKEVSRIAVGVGPGSFTGVRVALALGQGLMLGLGVPGVGLPSLQVLAAGLPATDKRVRVTLQDARREEFFFAAYDADGKEICGPEAIVQKAAPVVIAEKLAGRDYVVLGAQLPGVPCTEEGDLQFPDAKTLARIAASVSPEQAPVVPLYLRGPNIVRPKLKTSPLSLPRS